MMDRYEQALRDWFYSLAYIPSDYSRTAAPDEEATTRLKEHIERGCAVVYESEPKVSDVSGYGGTLGEEVTIRGIKARVRCACGRFPRQEWNTMVLFIPGEPLLIDVVRGVLEQADRS